MQHADPELVRTLVELRREDARARQRVDVLVRERRRARRREDRSRPARWRLARAVPPAAGAS